MNDKEAIGAFGALAQPHRLAVFRLLVRSGQAGMAAGEIADAIGIPASTLSHHLATLERARLLASHRIERRIIYRVDMDGTRQLIAFLCEDCCGGQPDLCGLPLVDGAVDAVTGLRPPAPLQECPEPELAAAPPAVRLRRGA